ncbi:DNA mismatch repair protein MutS [Lentilitoribacter sp. Alg239-R112]|uniref:DNA mismatch repair protein MutS n=1 Tax=Lentilitoribacter sp. Alg239-R112 TaxID=2305987 RepID=UPI001FCEEDA9|nr:DNA mismatch repair protein MutS [Lentilitoribacter sp. Alg239-R112]
MTNKKSIKDPHILSNLVSQESRASATPMMEQFIEIKATNPDSLLFYRMGDFYELFFDDAVDASRALGITLTKRGQHMGEDIPMCGVPVHAADDYLQKLIALGFRVSVCEQTEAPSEAKKRGAKSVVRRDVVRLVTPGTLTEEKLLTPSQSNYLMTAARLKTSGEHEFALAWADISTGQFRVCTSTKTRLLADILRIEPNELVVSENLFHDEDLRATFDILGTTAVPQPAVMFDSTVAEDRIKRFFDISALDGIGNFSRVELAAIAATIGYIEKTQLDERPPLEKPSRDGDGQNLFIDPATRANLELVRTLSGEKNGSLLKAIDRTVTGGGGRLLAERLMSPLTDPDEINTRLDSVSWFIKDNMLSEQLAEALKAMPDMPRALSRLALNRGGPRDLGTLRMGISTSREVLSIFGDRHMPVEISDAVTHLSSLPAELLDSLNKTLSDELPLLKRDGGFIKKGYHETLDECLALRDQSRQVIAGLQLKYAEETSVKNLKIKHNNMLGYFIEVTAQNASALTSDDEAKAKFIHRQTMANAMRFTTTELAELESKIANSANEAIQIELSLFDELCELVVKHASLIKNIADAISTIDVAIANADLAQEQGYCRPQVDHSHEFNIVAGRHPVVEQALRLQSADPFVANDCNLSPNETEQNAAIWLLTGPNMGGKSTFLRQNALIAIMAQMGSYVPAGHAHIGIVDRLFSRVGASDDLARGRSTFMVEMVETAAILNQATERSLVILDEIGRGTSTFDGLSIAWAAVEHLHEVNCSRGLFATHFHELTALSDKLVRLSTATMKVKEWDGDVVFLHEVGPGTADRSYGIQVARLAGLPDIVVNRAREVLKQLEENDRENPAQQLIDDLPLFSVKADIPTHHGKNEPSEVENLLQSLNPDDMSPREALEKLYELKHHQNKNET